VSWVRLQAGCIQRVRDGPVRDDPPYCCAASALSPAGSLSNTLSLCRLLLSAPAVSGRRRCEKNPWLLVAAVGDAACSCIQWMLTGGAPGADGFKCSEPAEGVTRVGLVVRVFSDVAECRAGTEGNKVLTQVVEEVGTAGMAEVGHRCLTQHVVVALSACRLHWCWSGCSTPCHICCTCLGARALHEQKTWSSLSMPGSMLQAWRHHLSNGLTHSKTGTRKLWVHVLRSVWSQHAPPYYTHCKR
jgi:hypothetical protein